MDPKFGDEKRNKNKKLDDSFFIIASLKFLRCLKCWFVDDENIKISI